ncbi:MAG: aspartate-semialdehyde dehydrogenase [bacterium]|nr:aspartate-semialdehyde dehydrogenase [candidate division KSB1 bacterium]MDH7561320.1 aspartate-semialdehyde dehydrogenase [bacterium]
MSTLKQVAILGATGAVGQRLVQILAEHPWFAVTTVAASERSAGRPYAEAVHWLLPGPIPASLARLRVVPAVPEWVPEELVFSALDASVATEAELAFRAAGRTVISNASSHRWDPQVPLVVPEINVGHLVLAQRQREKYGGTIVANPNCTTLGLCLALEPLRLRFGLKRVLVTTLQALSGAGYPGVPSLEAVDNVLPEIAGEEQKVETEPRKIFGRLNGDGVELAEVTISAQCNRVPVREGHLLSVSVELGAKATLEEVKQAFLDYRSPLSGLGFPSAPERPVLLTEASRRPQPLLDRDAAGGMAVTVGRVRPCPVLDYRFVALVHNTLRGAAGGTVLVGEVMVNKAPRLSQARSPWRP